MAEYKGVPTDQWLMPQDDAEILTQIQKANPIAELARKVPMRTKQRTKKRAAPRHPRFLSGGGGQNAAYPRETRQGDIVTLTAEKMGLINDYDEDDLADLNADVIAANITETRVEATTRRVRAMIATDVGKQGFADDYALGKDSELGVGAPYESVLNVKRWGRGGQGTIDLPQTDMILEPGKGSGKKYAGTGTMTGTISGANAASTTSGLIATEGGAYTFLSHVKKAVQANLYGNYYQRDRMVWFFDEGWEHVLENSLDGNGLPMLTSISEGASDGNQGGPRILGSPSRFVKGMTIANSDWEQRDYIPVTGLGTSDPPDRLGREGDIAIQYQNSGVIPNDNFGIWQRQGEDASKTWKKLTFPGSNKNIGPGNYISQQGATRPSATNLNGTGDMEKGGFMVRLQQKQLLEYTGSAAAGAIYDVDSDLLMCLYAHRDHLLIGPRMETQFMMSTSDAFTAYDSVAVKFRERQAFCVYRPEAMAVGIVEDS
ncbi:MAG: hypothetical protein OXG15_04975 [Gammaproteobacteria bacterium]|nr:hypothetical protein [Gammaproteobacteria bacterium]